MIHDKRTTKVEFSENTMWVTVLDGRRIGIPLTFFPHLLNATSKQLENYIISGNGTDLHWVELDEDISVENLFNL